MLKTILLRSGVVDSASYHMGLLIAAALIVAIALVSNYLDKMLPLAISFLAFFMQEVIPSQPPRLFHCSNASGRFLAEEILEFTQEVRSESLTYFDRNVQRVNYLYVYSGVVWTVSRRMLLNIHYEDSLNANVTL